MVPCWKNVGNLSGLGLIPGQYLILGQCRTSLLTRCLDEYWKTPKGSQNICDCRFHLSPALLYPYEGISGMQRQSFSNWHMGLKRKLLTIHTSWCPKNLQILRPSLRNLVGGLSIRFLSVSKIMSNFLFLIFSPPSQTYSALVPRR